MVCFALNGEPSSAWQFLPPDIWGIFFCGSEISLPDATGGSAPLAVFAGGAHPSLLRSFLSHGRSEATGHLPRGHRASPVLCPPLSSPSTARGAAVRPLTRGSRSCPGARVWVRGPAAVQRLRGRGGAEKTHLPLKVLNSKQLWHLGK